MEVNYNRLKQRFYQVAKIGKTSNDGVHRLALTDNDKAVRDLIMKWLTELNLQIRIDDFGNIYAKKEGLRPGLPPVITGSHLDSVPSGGKFDGTLGILAGLEIMNTMVENNMKHDYPIEIAVFTNEEGARFSTPMLGSGAIAGVFQQEYVHQMKDDQGVKFKDDLKKIGYFGEKENRLEHIKSFIELHIEQGPILFEKNIPIGIVKGIQGLSWHEVTFKGESNHAGPTPMTIRKDAFISAIKAMNQIHSWVNSLKDGTSVTFGKCFVKPNVVNVVPGEVSFTVDIRNRDGEVLRQHIDKFKEIILDIASHDDVDGIVEDISFMEPVLFSNRLIQELENISNESGLLSHVMYSGAGHDSMYLNRLGDTAMIFVPSINGKSHCEEEESLWSDICQGVDLLYELICSEVRQEVKN